MRSTRFSLFVVAVLIGSLLALSSTVVLGQQQGLNAVNLVAAQDAYTDIVSKTTMFGATDSQFLKAAASQLAGCTVSKVIWLKFNVDTLPDTGSYILRLDAQTTPLAAATMAVYAAPDTWSESTITWDSQPFTPTTSSPTPLATQTVPAATGAVTWASAALDTYIDGERTGGTGGNDGVASLALAYTTCGGLFGQAVTFDSRENTAGPGPLRVDLVSFAAVASGGAINLEWSTASEPNNEGFNLYRSEAEDGEYIKINDALIPAQGNASTGASYSFTDTEVKRGRTYYYKLEDVDTSGVSTFHGPVSATVRGKGR